MAEKDVIITFDTLFDLARREKYREEIQKIDPKFFEDVIKYFNEKQAILESQEKKKSVFAAAEHEKTRGQLNEAKRLLKDIYTFRESKIVRGALFQSRCNGKGFDFSALLPEEIEMFNSLQSSLMKYREEILHSLLNHEAPKVEITREEEPEPEPKNEEEIPKSSVTGVPDLSQQAKGSVSGAPNLSLQAKGLKTGVHKSDGSCCISLKCELPEFMGPDMNKYGPFRSGETTQVPEQVAEMLVKSGNANKAD
jgi:DNA replication initiation complex subunit (GINS family)